MKYTSRYILYLFASIFVIDYAMAGTLTVEVTNIKKAGELHLAIYEDADLFENDDGEKSGTAIGIIDGVIEDVKPGKVSYQFTLPTGTYAIGIFVDANYNNELDRNFFGVPSEQYGFSNNAKGSFGPPSFKDASFTITGDMSQNIDL